MTFTVVMRDAATGALGVAGQSHWFNLGRIVPWARAGVGAVATQSMADPLYGPRALDLMESGASAPEALAALLEDDSQREYRQVAIVDAAGNVAAHTGTRCIRHAGHEIGEGWSVQANIMRSEAVIPAMAKAARDSSGSLPVRLLSVVEAAEEAGGDLRGSQSAALVVVTDGPVSDADLRVDDHPDPIGELRRLIGLHRTYGHMTAGDDALASGDRDAAAGHYTAAMQQQAANAEILFWGGLALVTMERIGEGIETIRKAFAANPDLLELLRRLPECGLADEEDVTLIIDVIG